MKEGPFFATLSLLVIGAGCCSGAVGLIAVDRPLLGYAALCCYAALQSVALAVLLRTALSDPGVIPRRRNAGEAPSSSLPPIVVDGRSFPAKWCQSCRLVRPPRAAHCRVCDVCVEVFDHHCPWVGACVGKRNLKHFLLFIVVVVVDCAATIALSALQLILAVYVDGRSLLRPQSVPALVAGILAGFCAFPAVGLLFYNAGLVRRGLTTREDMKGIRGGGAQASLSSVLCGPEYVSVPEEAVEGEVVVISHDEPTESAALLIN